jgi:hypothetical protein
VTKIYQCSECPAPCTLAVSGSCTKPRHCPYGPGDVSPVWKRMRTKTPKAPRGASS